MRNHITQAFDFSWDGANRVIHVESTGPGAQDGSRASLEEPREGAADLNAYLWAKIAPRLAQEDEALRTYLKARH